MNPDQNKICQLFGIRYPIIQAGMVWVSGWKLASAVSNAGGLGLIGAGSMHPDVLRTHIQKCKAATSKPFGVNVPLMYPELETIMNIIVEEQVGIVFTSSGSPAIWTSWLKERGIIVAHVIANTKFAEKSQAAGVDAIVAEGFEAGGHNGRDETTTMVLIPSIYKIATVPLIAAGGIATGRGMLAAMSLGADGVQVGSRFALSEESSAHPLYKKACLEARDGATILTMKDLVPVRLIKNKFYQEVKALEDRGAPAAEIKELLGKGRAKKGIFEGNLDEGELEIGQASMLVESLKSAGEIVNELLEEYNSALKVLHQI